MYLTMYLSKKLYSMILSDRGRETERPFNLVLKLNLNKNEYNNYLKLSRQNIKEDYKESLLMKCNQSQEKLNRMGL